METLILNSLEIRKFRGFQHLQIEYLGRVNLIVGKNNVGKSNLLAALQMYAQRASTPIIISEIMETSQPSKDITCVLVPANGLNREQIIELWHGIASTELEGEVNTALRLIAPGVEGLNLVSTPASKGERDFRLARSLNVQVFATTHSWDCIEAFQRAGREDHQEERFLIRLESKKGEIGVTLYDERVLTIATREHIEVR